MEVEVSLHSENFILVEFKEGNIIYGIPLNFDECTNLFICLEECLLNGKLELLIDDVYVELGSTMRHVTLKFFNSAPVLGFKISRRQADNVYSKINEILTEYSGY